jgi:preprotein translocase subunit SecG
MFGILIGILILDSLLLGAVVLLQAGKGGGLAALGGGASTDSFFGGRQATTILTKMSWWCGGIFLGLSLVLAGMSTRGTMPRSVLDQDVGVPAPVMPATAPPIDLQPTGDDQPPPEEGGRD